jgi:hypothetical protein
MAIAALFLCASTVFAAHGYQWISGYLYGFAVSLAVLRWKTGIW